MRRKAFLGLLALFLHVAAPLLGEASPQPVTTVEVCTVHGVVSVEFDAGNAPAPTVPASGHCDLCACHGMAAAVPFATAAGWPLRVAQAARACPSFVPSSPTTASRPRAPPLPS
jgi:hypothetical protein